MTARATFALEEGPVRKPLRMWDGDISMLAWEGAGSRAPAVHFAHANGFNALTYRTLFDELSLFMRIYASDLRGHGQSTLAANPKGMRSWQIYCDDILRTIQEIDGRPKILAGHSLGATASLMAALANPSWVTGLLLIEPVLLPPSELRRLGLLKAAGLLKMSARSQAKRGVWPSRDAMFDAYKSRGAFRQWPEEVVRDFVTGGSLDYIDYRQVRLACTPGWETANYRAGPPNVWKGLSSLKVPITVILGEKRSTCPDESVALLQKKQPGVRIVRVPGSSHFLPMEQPDVVRLELRLLAKMLDGNSRNH
ncbi:MAG: alpha/beta hydrolase [Micropepsaceae bacterium]